MLNSYEFMIAHPDVFKQLAVKDLLFVYYKCPQVDKLLHMFSHYNEIAFTLSGSKTLHQGEQSVILTEDMSTFIRKSAHIEEINEMVGWKVLAFYFSDDFMSNVFNEYKSHLPLQDLPTATNNILIPVHINETTRAFVYSMVPYFNQKEKPSEILLVLKFKELFFNILSDPENRSLLALVHHISERQKTPIWEIMESNYMYNLKLPEIALMAGRSLTAFKKEFQQYYHTTPGRWLTNKRLEHAKNLLNSSQKSISEIAFESGFENVSHFSRIFKERFSLTPNQFRKSGTARVG